MTTIKMVWHALCSLRCEECRALLHTSEKHTGIPAHVGLGAFLAFVGTHIGICSVVMGSDRVQALKIVVHLYFMGCTPSFCSWRLLTSPHYQCSRCHDASRRPILKMGFTP